jgi:V8-like Glu-specific endopeptidase
VTFFKLSLGVLGGAAAVLWAMPSDLSAQRGRTTTGMQVLENRSDAAAYWTPARMAAAQPVGEKIPLASPLNTLPDAVGTSTTHDSWSPASKVTATAQQLYDPADTQMQLLSDIVAPQWFGTSNARFSSSRLVPATTTTDQAYPFRVIGKLFFTIPNQGNYVCSASVISYRLIATAGHCVTSGTGVWYGNFQFVPALRNGAGPWGSYGWAYATTTSAWFNGGGGVPNEADYAMIELGDKNNQTIGGLLGWLGWQTSSLSGNHAHLMGYPCNLDSCNQMHQVSAQAFSNAANNTVTYGSNMRGGSSGGPWIMNFGELSTCTEGCGGSDTGMNRIIGVTSYGPVATDPLYQGASILDSRWTSLWTTACGHRAGNC